MFAVIEEIKLKKERIMDITVIVEKIISVKLWEFLIDSA